MPMTMNRHPWTSTEEKAKEYKGREEMNNTMRMIDEGLEGAAAENYCPQKLKDYLLAQGQFPNEHNFRQ